MRKRYQKYKHLGGGNLFFFNNTQYAELEATSWYPQITEMEHSPPPPFLFVLREIQVLEAMSL